MYIEVIHLILAHLQVFFKVIYTNIISVHIELAFFCLFQKILKTLLNLFYTKLLISKDFQAPQTQQPLKLKIFINIYI